MANERVSQLQDLFASDIQSNDLFLVTDMSQRESKRLEVGQLLLFIESSGSFFAYHATNADTASYVRASAIDGAVSVALNASRSISSSYSDKSISASYSDRTVSSSYSSFCVATLTEAETASFLKYTGTPNGTASYSLKSLTSDTATTAVNLLYTGIPNGTASFAITSSNSKIASLALSSSTSVSSSYALSSSFASNAYFSIFSGTASIASNAISSSVSDTASFISANVYGPKFIAPVTVRSSTTAVAYTTFNCTAYVPRGTQTVILDGWAEDHGGAPAGFIQIRPNATSSADYVLISYKGGGVGVGAQGCFPISSSIASSSFQYSFTENASSGIVLRLIGYY